MSARLPKVKLKAIPVFPTSVTGENGIAVTKVSGEYTVGIDVSDFQIATVTEENSATTYAISWGQVTDDNPAGSFQLTPFSGIQASSDDLASLSDLGTLGVVVRESDANYVTRTITGTANEITITNGSGVAGNPTASLPSALTFTGKTVTGGTFSSPTFVTPALGTPASGVATNLTGTAAGLTAGHVTTNANMTGDVTSVGNATTLATVNSNVGTFGSATQSVQFTVNGKGLMTAAANVTVTPAVGSITGLGTGVATALGVNIGSAGAPVLFNGAGGTPSSMTLTSATGLPISTGLTGAGTGVLTALGVNIGSAGAPVLFNGAGGTPSSITLTNASGTAASLTAGNATTLATARTIDGQSFNGSANITVIAPGTHAATSKATPVDADELPLVDSAASNVLKRLTWLNLKATLKTYLDTLYTPIGTPVLTVKKQAIIVNGNYVPSTGMLYCIIEAVGAGGGGGSAAGSVGSVFAGGGGGAGGYSRGLHTAADIGASKAVVIGTAGAGGASGSNNGTAGTDTTVGGTLVVAKGGGGGNYGSSGQLGSGGAGGIAGTGNQVAATGAPGFFGVFESGSTTFLCVSGTGGSGPFGGGGAGIYSGFSAAGGGGAGSGYGSGGAGAEATNIAANAAGGNGTAGFVMITEFCSQ